MDKILFLTTAHQYNDDRIFYHQAKSLSNLGFKVKICSLCSDYKGVIDNIEIEAYSILRQSTRQKIEVFRKICYSFEPDCIICSEPLAVIAAKSNKTEKKVRIIYDITEWYPSFRMLQPYNFFMKWFHAFKFFLIQLFAGFHSDRFIFGETTKKFPLAYLFPFKKKLLLPYYPSSEYITLHTNKLKYNKITLAYTGRISREDGIENFFRGIHKLREMRTDLDISILIIGAPKKDSDSFYFSNLLEEYQWKNIRIKKNVPFEIFSSSYAEADICLDLREKNFEYNHCLPIKLFYYAASGKPVIYTDLKAIRKHMDISAFGYLVDPQDPKYIAELIVRYIEIPGLYDKHAQNARKAYEDQFNWGKIENSFIDFVQQSVIRR